MGIVNVLRGLSRDHPLIFSPNNIDKYIRRTGSIASWSDSLCRISDRAVSPRVKKAVSATFERMLEQYPGVPKDDNLLLLECALESVIYKSIKKENDKDGSNRFNLVGPPRKECCDDILHGAEWTTRARENRDKLLDTPGDVFGGINDQNMRAQWISREDFSSDISLSSFCALSEEAYEMENTCWSLSDEEAPGLVDVDGCAADKYLAPPQTSKDYGSTTKELLFIEEEKG
ncbi:hypothetical protein BGX27_000027 [Mortierella sp. AM989]|nr:hypothetical protein BGX27_000027 [Mortierella sp. AM989]